MFESELTPLPQPPYRSATPPLLSPELIADTSALPRVSLPGSMPLPWEGPVAPAGRAGARAAYDTVRHGTVQVIARPARWQDVGTHWKSLDAISRGPNFMIGALWTATWLETFAGQLAPEALLFQSAGQIVGACLLVSAVERRGPFRIRRLYLNTAGESAADRSAMEFNGVLCLPGFEAQVAAALAQEVSSRRWDEFVVEGCCGGAFLDALRQQDVDGSLMDVAPQESRFVDLERLRATGASFESTLSSNTRTQIRRSIRSYETQGVLKLERADSAHRAEQFLGELADLHQRRWTERGQPGAFASERRMAFHRALIGRGVPSGTVDLLRIQAGERTVGLLYNFVHRGKVYFYQSGFQYESDAHRKPGLVTHSMAVEHYLRNGLIDYDFMAGDMQYKRSLATDARELYWVNFQRRTARMRGMEALRVARRTVRHRLEKGKTSALGHRVPAAPRTESHQQAGK